MKVKLTIEKTIYEEKIIEMDERFRICACPFEELDKVPRELFAEAEEEASQISGLRCADERFLEEEDLAKGVITAAECVDNGELIFEC